MLKAAAGNAGGGGLTWPAFSVYQAAMGVTGAGITVTYNAALANVGSSLNLATGLFTAPVAGLYHFTFSGIKQTGLGSTEVVFIVSGVPQVPRAYTDPSGYTALSIATTLSLAAGATVGVRVTGGSIHGNNANEFSGFLIVAN